MEAAGMMSPLRKGDVVTVRMPDEILATLDERGELDGLPFMPEMVYMCGRSFRVSSRAERVCDTILGVGSRSMNDTVFLEDLRCSGAAHGGCAAECRIYWKESWLTFGSAESKATATASDRVLLDRISLHTTQSDDPGALRYRCQATQALAASTPLSSKDIRSYLREYKVGNVSLHRLLLVLARAAVMEPARKLRLLPAFPLRGPRPKSTRTPTLGLQAGEWVRVKSPAEIQATLNDKGNNRGLSFDREMLPFCGREFQVRQRVDQLIDEKDGRMIQLTSDCVTLDGAVCSGERSTCRWFCQRALFPCWREGWLERIPRPIVPEELRQSNHGSVGERPILTAPSGRDVTVD
jgi:hypothetical protein